MARNSQTFNASLRLNSSEFKKGVAEVKKSLMGLRNSFLSLAGALGAGLGFTQLISNVKDTAVQLSVAKATLENVSTVTKEYETEVGKVSVVTKNYGENLAYVKKMSDDYAQDLVALTNNFAQFHAACEKTNINLEQQKAIFEQLTRAATYYHMSADRTKDMMNAIVQMASKGKVAAEELRRQLGNSLPGAFNLMAAALGVTTDQLDDMMRKGQVLAEDALPKFAAMLKTITTDINLDSLQLSLNRLKNSWYELVQSAGAEDIFDHMVKAANKAVGYVANNINDIKSLFKGLAISVATIKIFDYFKAQGDRYIKDLDAQLKSAELRLKVFKSKVQASIAGGGLNAGQTAEGFYKGFGQNKTALNNMVNYNRELIKANQLQHELYGTPLFDPKVIDDIEEFHKQLGFIPEVAKSASKQIGLIGRALMSVKAVASTLLKTFMQFLPALAFTAAITAITTIVDRAKQLREQMERINNIQSDYNTRIETTVAHAKEQVTIMESYMDNLDRELGTEEERLVTIQKINEMMGTNFGADAVKKTSAAYKELTRQTGLWAQTLVLAAEMQAHAQEKAEAEVRLNELRLGLTKKQAKYEEKTVQSMNWKGELQTYNRFPLNGAQTLKKEMEGDQEEVEILDEIVKNTTTTIANLQEQFNKLMVEMGNKPNTNNGVETDINKIYKKYNEAKDQLANMLREGAITQEKYNEELDKLNQEYWQNAAATGKLSIEAILAKMDKGKTLTAMEKWYKELWDAAASALRNTFLEGMAEQFAKEVEDSVERESEILKKELEDWSEREGQKSKSDLTATVMEKPTRVVRDTTFDYKTSESDKLSGEAEAARKTADAFRDAIENLKNETESYGEVAIAKLKELEAELKLLEEEAQTFEELMKLQKIDEDIKKLQNDIAKTASGGLKDLAQSTDRIVKGIENIKETFDDVDATGWEKFMAIFNEVVQIVETIVSITQTIQTLNGLLSELENAKIARQKQLNTLLAEEVALRLALKAIQEDQLSDEEKSVAMKILESIANKKEASSAGAAAVANATASGAKLPFPYNLAAIAAGVAAVVAALSFMGKFANGGIVGGNSYSGDHNVVRANSGELILNKAQQGTLYKAIATGNLGGGNVEFTIRGADLVGTINNYNRLRK